MNPSSSYANHDVGPAGGRSNKVRELLYFLFALKKIAFFSFDLPHGETRMIQTRMNA